MTADGQPPAPLVCRAVQRHEINSAVKLILGNDGRLAGDAQVLDFLSYAIDRGINLNETWVAIRADRLAWATLPVINPGRTMLLLLPDTAPAGDLDSVQTLLGTVCDHFSARGITMTQALLDPTAKVANTLSDVCGFSRLAELLYLQGDVRRSPGAPTDLRLTVYSPVVHDQFASAVLTSYEESLDCPALNGLRSIGDIIVGHKATGQFVSDLWLLATDNAGSSLGVLLLAVVGESTMELVYLGVCPTARGKGLGKALLRHAMAIARSRGMQRLTLAVDAANQPALGLYYGHGMHRICSKVAMMRDLRPLHLVADEPIPV